MSAVKNLIPFASEHRTTICLLSQKKNLHPFIGAIKHSFIVCKGLWPFLLPVAGKIWRRQLQHSLLLSASLKPS